MKSFKKSLFLYLEMSSNITIDQLTKIFSSGGIEEEELNNYIFPDALEIKQHLSSYKRRTNITLIYIYKF